MTEDKKSSFINKIAGLLATAVGLIVLPVAAIWIVAGPSQVGWAFVAAALTTWVGLLIAAYHGSGWLVFVLGAAAMTAIPIVHNTMANDVEGVQVVVETPGLNAFLPVPERDLALTGALALDSMGYFSSRGERTVVPSMRKAYSAMDAAYPLLPSLAPTHLSERVVDPNVIDAIYFSPAEATERIVVFLHGYGGNWTLPCWIVAKTALEFGYATVCPTLDLEAKWWEQPGRELVDTLMHRLRSEGYKSIILGGLSSGAVGASSLAFQFAGEVDALFFVSGVTPGAKLPDRPTLIFHGKEDEMAPLAEAKELADKNEFVSFVQVEGGHFALLSKYERFEEEFGRILNDTKFKKR